MGYKCGSGARCFVCSYAKFLDHEEAKIKANDGQIDPELILVLNEPMTVIVQAKNYWKHKQTETHKKCLARITKTLSGVFIDPPPQIWSKTKWDKYLLRPTISTAVTAAGPVTMPESVSEQSTIDSLSDSTPVLTVDTEVVENSNGTVPESEEPEQYRVDWNDGSDLEGWTRCYFTLMLFWKTSIVIGVLSSLYTFMIKFHIYRPVWDLFISVSGFSETLNHSYLIAESFIWRSLTRNDETIPLEVSSPYFLNTCNNCCAELENCQRRADVISNIFHFVWQGLVLAIVSAVIFWIVFLLYDGWNGTVVVSEVSEIEDVATDTELTEIAEVTEITEVTEVEDVAEVTEVKGIANVEKATEATEVAEFESPRASLNTVNEPELFTNCPADATPQSPEASTPRNYTIAQPFSLR